MKEAIKEFAHEHPFMTLFLGLAALNTVRILVRGYDPTWASAASSASSATKTSGIAKVAGFLTGAPEVTFPEGSPLSEVVGASAAEHRMHIGPAERPGQANWHGGASW